MIAKVYRDGQQVGLADAEVHGSKRLSVTKAPLRTRALDATDCSTGFTVVLKDGQTFEDCRYIKGEAHITRSAVFIRDASFTIGKTL